MYIYIYIYVCVCNIPQLYPVVQGGSQCVTSKFWGIASNNMLNQQPAIASGNVAKLLSPEMLHQIAIATTSWCHCPRKMFQPDLEESRCWLHMIALSMFLFLVIHIDTCISYQAYCFCCIHSFVPLVKYDYSPMWVSLKIDNWHFDWGHVGKAME